MSLGTRHAAYLGQLDIRIELLSPLIERSGFTVHRATDAVAVLDLLWNVPCELVVVNHPVVGITLDNLVATMRDRSSPSRHAGLVLVVPDRDYGAISSLRGRGVSRVVARGELGQGLLGAVGDLLEVSPRVQVRAMVQVESRSSRRLTRSLFRTRDLSLTGMLLQGGCELPVGSEFSFELQLPGEGRAIVGSARVVRHTDASRETVSGVGASFADLESGSVTTLAEFLRREAS